MSDHSRILDPGELLVAAAEGDRLSAINLEVNEHIVAIRKLFTMRSDIRLTLVLRNIDAWNEATGAGVIIHSDDDFALVVRALERFTHSQ